MKLNSRESQLLRTAVELRMAALNCYARDTAIVAAVGEEGVKVICAETEEYARLLRKINLSAKGTARMTRSEVTEEEKTQKSVMRRGVE